MALVTCPTCGSDDIHVDGTLDDGSKQLRCANAHSWVRETSTTPQQTLGKSPFEVARLKFPTASMVDSGRAARVAALKAAFLKEHPAEDPEVAPYWAKYQQVFSAEGLPTCNPQDLKDFANNAIGANPGNMSVFNRAWNQMGSAAAAERVRDTVEYLLRGPSSIPIEDRLTHLIEGHKGMGMTGFRESLLTRVLCIMFPDDFVPILTYGTSDEREERKGKAEITQAVFGLKMPKKDQISMQSGRLAYWSNSLLNELLGDGFQTGQHKSEFLWWAKDQA